MATPTPAATPTATPIPTFTLSGVIFFDYNGSGVRDDNEPGVSGATVQVGKLVATTASDGKYTLHGVPKGSQQVRLSASGFRYVSLSLSAFQPSDQPVSLIIDSDAKRDWGLMQGFLTLPFKCGTQYRISNYFDLDFSGCQGVDPHQCSKIRDWQGGKQTYDGHGGIDYVMPEGTPILASASGVVVEASFDNRKGNYVVVEHGFETATGYHHLAGFRVSKNQRVARGQRIALSGNTGDSSEPHLDFQLSLRSTLIDIYRDFLNPNSKNWWTKDSDPQCIQ
jgi:murein DD-endopeptidase MepM/ murein hydrolase activator NlpD